jgi:hypothetical protein
MSRDNRFQKLLLMPAIATLAILLIPFIAKADWSPMDFIIAGFLLFCTGFTFKLATWKANSVTYKVAAAIALGSGLFLIWANLAVGIVGSENNPINVLYFGVIAIGLIGSVISGFRANGMTYTMFSMAGSLFLIALIVLITGEAEINDFPGRSIWGFWAFHAFFAVQFVIAALLFYSAAKELPPSATKLSTKK